MATAGSIVVSLLAQTGSFETDMERARRKVDQTARTVNRTVAAMAAASAAFAGASVAIAVSTAKAMDATAKMAQQIGVTTEALTSMRFAVQQFANVSDQTFDMALRRMTRRIEEAAAGSGAAKEALKALGLSAKELAQISPDRQFLALADALSKTESQAARLRFTMALLDTEGVPLVTALQQGSRALEEATQQAERFGVVLSYEAARAAERFADNMDHLGRVQDGYKQQLTTAVLPSLISFTDLLLDIADSAGPVEENIQRALTAAGVAATGAAAIFAGRFAGAATLSVDRLMAKANAAIRAQYELIKLGGAGRIAAAGMTATATAARAGSLALGLVGGPLGIITTLLTAGAAAWLIWGRDAARAQGSVDALTQSMEDLNHEFLMLSRNKREQMLMGLEEDMRSLQGEIDRSIDKLREMSESAADWAAMPEGMRPIYQSLRDDIQAVASSSLDADEKTAILKARIEGLEGIVPDDIYRKMLEIALAAAAGSEEVSELVSRIQKLQEQIDAPVMLPPRRIRPGGGGSDFEKELKSLLDKLLPAEAALRDYHKSLNMILSAHQSGRLSIAQYTTALQNLNVAYATQVNDLLPEAIKKAQEQVKAARDQQRQLQQQIRTFGMAESAVLALAAADTDSAIAKLEATKASEIANGATTERIKHIEAEIQVLRELRDLQLGSAGLQGQLEWREQQRQQWEAWAQDVETIFDQVGQSLTDAIFEGGKSGRDLLKDLFKTLAFRVLIQPVMGQMQGWVTNQLGGLFGYQNPQQGGGGFSMPSGLGGIGNAFSWAGNAMGSASLGQFGAGMTVGAGGAFTDAGAQAFMDIGVGGSSGFDAGNWIGENGANILSAASVIYDVSQGNYGRAAGTVIGSFLPIPGGQVIGNVVGGLLDGIFGDDKPRTRHAQMSHADLGADGTFSVTSWDDRQSRESQIAAAAYATEAVRNATELFGKIGIDAEFKRFTTLMESSILGDRQGVGSSGTIRIGDLEHEIGLAIESSWTKHGFGGWSEAEMLPRLMTDVQLTILEAFQAAGDQLPSVLSGMLEGVDIRSLGAEQAQALAQSFQLVVDQVSAFQAAVELLPFANLRDLSFDAAAGLVELAGGVENLLTAEQSYIQNYLTEAERTQLVWDEIGRVLGGVNIAVPETRAEFHAIKASLDLSTESGREAYAAIMSVQQAFASLTPSADELAAAAQRAADEVAQAAARIAQQAWDGAVAEGEAAYAALSRSIAAQKARVQRESEAIAEALRNSISAASSTVSELTSLTGRLTSTVQRMVSTGLDDARNREWAQERISRALSVATLTGVMPQGADFEQALQIVAQPSQGLFDSFEDYQADFLRSAHDVSKLNELAGVQLTTEQRALESLQNQLQQNQEWYQAEMARLDGVLEYWRQQIDIATGTYQAELTQTEAIRAVEAAIKKIRLTAPEQARATQSAAAASSEYDRAMVYLANSPDVVAAYGEQGGGRTLAQFARDHYEQYGRWEGRAFAAGGFAAPGWAMVGEKGPELVNFSQPGRVYSADQTSDILRSMMSGGNRDNEIKLLRQEIRELKLALERKLDEGNDTAYEHLQEARRQSEMPQPVVVTNVVPTIEAVPGQ